MRNKGLDVTGTVDITDPAAAMDPGDPARKPGRALMAATTAAPYESPDDWRAAAMRRPVAIDDGEVGRRRAVAEAHHRHHGQPDADALADQELFILGKMDIDEYRDYLIFKFMYGVE